MQTIYFVSKKMDVIIPNRNRMKRLLLSLILLTSLSLLSQEKSFADHWEYVGVAVEEPGYVIWGTSPVMDDGGKVHLFVARWPGNTVGPG